MVVGESFLKLKQKWLKEVILNCSRQGGLAFRPLPGRVCRALGERRPPDVHRGPADGPAAEGQTDHLPAVQPRDIALGR